MSQPRGSPHMNQLQNGSAPTSPSPAMSNQNQQAGGQSRPANYPSPTNSYPSPSSSQFYQNSTPQHPENYRASPTANTGGSGLPSIHNFSVTAPHLPSSYYNQASNQYSVTSDPNMRYPLPAAHNSSAMAPGRNKKEIKRRTKTGCLTCRKRRIKCDEAHPACRNCQKSKRECLGYDPIFKPQPGPAAIQPAPTSGSSSISAAATSNPYGAQSQMMQGGYNAPATSMGGYEPVSADVSSASSAAQQYNYAPAIDPALEAGSPGAVLAENTSSVHAKRTVQELLDLGGESPPSKADITQVPGKIDETTHLFFSIYAPGLQEFLETHWFKAEGAKKLLTDRALLEQFERLFNQFNASPDTDPNAMRLAANVEARVVWQLAEMVRAAAAESTKAEYKTLPALDDPVEANHRLTVFENLLTGHIASGNSLTRPDSANTKDAVRLKEMQFWYALGNFVCHPEDDPTSAKDIDAILATLRSLLDGRENRDVLYSIAVVRVMSKRVAEYTETDKPLMFNESDDRSKLAVAKKFINDEASGTGTTNVIRRFCELATRSWIPLGLTTK